MESPKLIYRNGYYYLTVAQGGTAGPATGHMVVSARSSSVFGPWEYSPHNPVIRATSREDRWWSRGHGTLIEAPDGDWWIMYHAYEKGYITLGRQTLLEPIEWTEEGWFKVPQHIDPAEPIRLPSGVKVPHGMTLSDDFRKMSLGLQWRFYNGHDSSRYQFTSDGIIIKGNSEENISPLTCLPVNHAYEVQVEMAVTGDAEGRLLLFYNPNCFCGITLVKEELYPILHTKKLDHGKIEVGQNTLHLMIRNEHHDVSFYYSRNGTNWKKYSMTFETSGYHHNVFGGFISLRVGLDAVGEGTVVFRNFLYREIMN